MECALSLSGNIGGALAEFNRVLTPAGKLIVTDIYVRKVFDPQGLNCLSATSCLAGIKTEETLRCQMENHGFKITLWQDQTDQLKKWLVRMVFNFGSLKAFYRQLVTCDRDARSLATSLGNQIQLGYYLMIAQKAD